MDQTLVGLLNGTGVMGVVLFTWWLVASGRLVTRREVDRMVEDHVREMDDLRHDRDEWRAAHRISETGRVVLLDQVGEMLEHSRTTEAFLRSLPRPPAQEAST